MTDSNEYQNVTQKLKYICTKHEEQGVLEISYSKFKSGQGCKYCGREKTTSTKRKPFNYDEARQLCQKYNFEFVDIKRENSILYIYFICPKHRQFGIQKMRKGNMKRGIKGCKYCKGDFPEWYVKDKIKAEYPHIKLIGNYVDMSTPLKCLCQKHGVEWQISPRRILSGVGCRECGKEKLSKKRMHTQEEFDHIVQKSNPDVEVISEYNGLEKDITVKCKKCGYIWTLNSNSLKVNGTRCKKCSFTYKGEDRISEVLSSLGYEFFRQYKFHDCTDKRPLPFDFYLPEYNLCIEFDGQQHFEPRFGYENFHKTQIHDDIKNNYCRNKNIELLRIPYWQSNDIKNIITKRINLLNKTN